MNKCSHQPVETSYDIRMIFLVLVLFIGFHIVLLQITSKVLYTFSKKGQNLEGGSNTYNLTFAIGVFPS